MKIGKQPDALDVALVSERMQAAKEGWGGRKEAAL